MSFQDLPKDKCFLFFFFLSETVIPVDIVPPRLKLPLKIICFTTGTVVPNGVNVQFDECFVDCRSLVVACELVRHQFPYCALSYFSELLPVSFNQEQQLACT